MNTSLFPFSFSFFFFFRAEGEEGGGGGIWLSHGWAGTLRCGGELYLALSCHFDSPNKQRLSEWVSLCSVQTIQTQLDSVTLIREAGRERERERERKRERVHASTTVNDWISFHYTAHTHTPTRVCNSTQPSQVLGICWPCLPRRQGYCV